MADLRKSLKSEKIQCLRLRSPLTVDRTTPLKNVLVRMREEKKGYAIVLDKGDGKKIVGIFTERDVMTRVIEQKVDLKTPVEKVMTPNPKVLKITDSVADAIALMSGGSYRHAPLVDDKDEVAGILGVRDLIQYLAEHYPYEVYNLPPDPKQIIRDAEGA